MTRHKEVEQRYTRQEVAARLRVSLRTVDNWISRGELRPVEVLGRAIRIPASTVEVFCCGRRA